MVRNTTMLQLVTSLTKLCRTDEEIVALAATLIDGGSVRLCGIFAGQTIDLNAARPIETAL